MAIGPVWMRYALEPSISSALGQWSGVISGNFSVQSPVKTGLGWFSSIFLRCTSFAVKGTLGIKRKLINCSTLNEYPAVTTVHMFFLAEEL